MRSQTATTVGATATSNRKRGRESTTPVRVTRPKRHHHHHPVLSSEDLSSLVAMADQPKINDDDDHVSQSEMTVQLTLLKNGRTDHHHSSSPVVGPLSDVGKSGQSAPPPPPPPPPTASKNRKQQQQQVANGFPVTVFPPADNNNSPSPSSAASIGLFQSRHHNNNNNSNGASKNKGAKNSPTTAAVAAVRLDNNKPEQPATVTSRREAPPTAGHRPDEDSAAVSIVRRHQMKEAFQPWVMQTYGDAAKTKTISRRKSERIARILKGEDRSNGADSSKFRFWVRAKGFRLGRPTPPPTETGTVSAANDHQPATGVENEEEEDLYVVTSTTKDDSSASGEDRPVYKKVAVVEDFFDIIYREHVEFMNNSGGRPSTGKHAGQKRTYRAITEIYAFLPREAVTRFLMQCADCQRRGNGASHGGIVSVSPPSSQVSGLMAPSGNAGVSPGSPTPPASPANANNGLSAPHSKTLHPDATTVHHHHLPPTPPHQHHHHFQQLPLMLAVTTDNIDLSLPLTSTLLKRATLAGVSHHQLLGLDRAESSFCSTGTSSSHQGMTSGHNTDESEVQDYSSKTSKRVSNGMASVHSSNNDPTSPITLDLSSKASDMLVDDHSPGAMKDEDDDDDDDVEDKIDTQDPERLKAFNMFVRLFVDENLDRMVPISRQPREKVQAIIDSCLRQFPEFGERARKRIRTYLKSCRRHKRTRDSSSSANDATSGGLVSPNSNRPMPPHLTSAVAEQILAQACENENQNAKRLRLGLEPISQPLPAGHGESGCAATSPAASQPSDNQSQSPASTSTGTIVSPTPSTSTTTTTTTGAATNLFRPAFGPYQRSSISSSHQGPTDLSTKSRTTSSILGPPTSSNGLPSRTSPLPHKLNAAEILAVRQLVTGYRESAAFLLRSADELEQLLHQQHTTAL